jgi:uncharacterized membrane protein
MHPAGSEVPPQKQTPPATFKDWLKTFDRDAPHLERLILVSDGIFAIALTLLALELRLPEDVHGTLRDLFRQAFPQLAAFAVSFIIIARMWNTHRHTLALTTQIDNTATALNFTFLAFVTLIPAAVRFYMSHLNDALGFMVYLGIICAIGLSHSALWAYLALWKNFMKPEVPLRYRRWFFAYWLLSCLAALEFLLGAHFQMTPTPTIKLPPTFVALEVVTISLWMLAYWQIRRIRKYPPVIA